ncbi:MAG: bacitracin resistance protein BacA [bacterium]|nr:bacitracin resistance protein BacA [bacterium]
MSQEQEIFVPPGGPPQKPVNRELFSILGEEEIRRLLLLHYQALAASGIAEMFPSSADALAAAANRSADFFIQIMGGPAYYSEKHGPPRMRMRHLPFEIHTPARDLWLECFRDALDALPFPSEHRSEFEEFLESFSMWMVNRA